MTPKKSSSCFLFLWYKENKKSPPRYHYQERTTCNANGNHFSVSLFTSSASSLFSTMILRPLLTAPRSSCFCLFCHFSGARFVKRNIKAAVSGATSFSVIIFFTHLTEPLTSTYSAFFLLFYTHWLSLALTFQALIPYSPAFQPQLSL